MSRYIDADKLLNGLKADALYPLVEKYGIERVINAQPTADVVEIGKPYFYEEGYVLKDFHNGGVHRYFVIERTEE